MALVSRDWASLGRALWSVWKSLSLERKDSDLAKGKRLFSFSYKLMLIEVWQAEEI